MDEPESRAGYLMTLAKELVAFDQALLVRGNGPDLEVVAASAGAERDPQQLAALVQPVLESGHGVFGLDNEQAPCAGVADCAVLPVAADAALALLAGETGTADQAGDHYRQLQILGELALEANQQDRRRHRLRGVPTEGGEYARMLAAMKTATAVGFALLDEAGRFVEVNDYVASLLDTPTHRLIGRYPLSMTLASARQRVASAISACTHGGHRITGDWPLASDSGYVRVARVTSERFWFDGTPHVFCVLTDATHERKEETLRETESETLKAVTLEHSLDAILANIGIALRRHRPDAMVVVTVEVMHFAVRHAIEGSVVGVRHDC